eukprot:TRINITY_DN107918_c0_g1_i1.p1 TRINITY_DN107918_c0_g1~~TRINITY_DN107918_c0_g1_i1.p1  ORF type:complete len:592 (+),score=138.64 TRINITY_DN107918_c0_g1_i1:25-1776(+)
MDTGEENEEVDLLTEKDLYKILGVSKGAKPDVIKKAYRTKSLKYHPDKNPSPDAKPIFQRITEAYSILCDDKKRLKYDKSGDMDLEDFDMDQFMNMWVGEMMEDGGMVDELMQGVLPWTDDEDKMAQFMEEMTKPQGKKIICTVCQFSASNKRLMLVHFDQKHKFDCEEWAKETVKSMKASFESFMKQVTGIENSGEFILPDGSKGDMSKVKGMVPDIRAHMQKRVDKAKEVEAVMDMYRKVAGAQYQPESSQETEPTGESAVQKTPDWLPEASRISEVLGVSSEEAEELRNDKEKLLRKLRTKIDQLNDEEDEEEAMMHAQAMGGLGMDGLDGLAGFEGLGDLEGLGGLGGLGALGGLGGFGGLGKGGLGSGKGGLAGMMGGMAGLEELLAGKGAGDPEALEAMMAQLGGLGGMPGMEGLLGGMPGMEGLGGLSGLGGLGGFGGLGGRGGLGAAQRGMREPRPRSPAGPSKEIGCACGYSCGTMAALDKHLSKFTGPEHKAVVTERPPSPPRAHAARHGADQGMEGMHCPPAYGRSGGLSSRQPVREEAPSLACSCGFEAGTAKALQRHFDRFPGDPSHVKR